MPPVVTHGWFAEVEAQQRSIDLARLAAVATQMHDSVCITDADLDDGPHIVYVNEAFTRLTGYEADAVVGLTPRILQGPKTERAVLDRQHRDLAAGREFQGEAINYRSDGGEFVMAWYVLPLCDEEGHVSHFVSVQRDVTEDRRQEAMAQLFVAAFVHTTDAILILDPEGRVLHVNPACAAMIDVPLDAITSRPVRETGLTPRRLRIYRDIVAALAEGGEWHGEYETSARRGEIRRLAVSISRVSTLDPAPRYIVDARDVTHQRRLEYIADAANLAENVGYVFAGLRHELGNPINSIKTALTVVRQNLSTLPPDRVEDYIDRVLQEMGRVEYLLRSMATFNSTHRPVLEAVPVAPFLARFATFIRSDVERRGVQLVLQIDEGAGAMLADARALHQVLLNLLTNALDALAEQKGARIRLVARRRGGHVHLTVADNGPGIPPERRAHVFKPFHTTKLKGTGLGLAIARKLVTLMRGTIEVESVGSGETAFTVTLDADPVELGRGRGSTRPPPPPRGMP